LGLFFKSVIGKSGSFWALFGSFLAVLGVQKGHFAYQTPGKGYFEGVFKGAKKGSFCLPHAWKGTQNDPF
jgi:hypothetical protein